MMRFLSVCSGIEAATVAWAPLGWSPVAFSEIEPFPCAVLAHHYPDVPNLGDMTTIAQRILNGEVDAPDVLAGGTPCQAFSVAGLRKSLADERGNITLKFVEIADAIDFVRVRDGRPPSNRLLGKRPRRAQHQRQRLRLLHGNHLNNSPENLERICRSCHNREHKPRASCAICGKPQKGLGYCDKHYQRFKKWGDPLAVKRNQHAELTRSAD